MELAKVKKEVVEAMKSIRPLKTLQLRGLRPWWPSTCWRSYLLTDVLSVKKPLKKVSI